MITSGEPSDAADNAVQPNIVPVGYTAVGQSLPASGTEYPLTNVHSGKGRDSVACGATDGTLVDLWSSLGNLCQGRNVTAYGGK